MSGFKKLLCVVCVCLWVGCSNDDGEDEKAHDEMAEEDADGKEKAEDEDKDKDEDKDAKADEKEDDSAAGGAGMEAVDEEDEEAFAACVEDVQSHIDEEACATCTCEHCAELFDLCANNPSSEFVAKCMGVFTCENMENCRAPECFCGTDEDGQVDLFSCSASSGPCSDAIFTAAGTTDQTALLTLTETMNNDEPLYVATQLLRCMVGEPGLDGECFSDCRP